MTIHLFTYCPGNHEKESGCTSYTEDQILDMRVLGGLNPFDGNKYTMTVSNLSLFTSSLIIDFKLLYYTLIQSVNDEPHVLFVYLYIWYIYKAI